MKHAQVLEAIRAERAEWDTLLAKLDDAQATAPGVAGHWSVLDVIAHIAWYEREMADLFETRRLTGSPWWLKPIDERNALIYELYRDQPLATARHEAQESYQRMMAALTQLDDDAMVNPAAFSDMPDEWVPWEIIAGNTFWHYREHAADVRSWLAA